LDHVAAYETRVDQDLTPVVRTFGSHGLGIDLTAEAWPRLEQVFSGGDDQLYEYFDRPKPPLVPSTVQRIPKQYLRHHKVDLLVLGNLKTDDHREWLKRIPRSGDPTAPMVVIEYWDPWFITRNDDGPMSKLVITQWDKKNYTSMCCTVGAVQAGGVVD
jgi:hypothetical protein